MKNQIYSNNKDRNDKDETRQDNSVNLTLGLKPVIELLEQNPNKIELVNIRKGWKSNDTTKILDLCREHNVRFALVPEEALQRMAEGSRHQGVVAKLKEVDELSFEELLTQALDAPLPLIIALDMVQDPGNVGTLARTLYALGGAGIVLPKHNSASLGMGAKKSAAGALDYLPIARVTNLARAIDMAKEEGYHTYTTSMTHNKPAEESEEPKTAKQKYQEPQILNPLEAKLFLPAILVLGGEEKGVRPLVAKQCDTYLSIPMLRDFDSINVAQAGGILISCFLKNIKTNSRQTL